MLYYYYYIISRISSCLVGNIAIAKVVFAYKGFLINPFLPIRCITNGVKWLPFQIFLKAGFLKIMSQICFLIRLPSVSQEGTLHHLLAFPPNFAGSLPVVGKLRFLPVLTIYRKQLLCQSQKVIAFYRSMLYSLTIGTSITLLMMVIAQLLLQLWLGSLSIQS